MSIDTTEILLEEGKTAKITFGVVSGLSGSRMQKTLPLESREMGSKVLYWWMALLLIDGFLTVQDL